jgi:phosphatidylinositol-3,4,5-trisphosphate 3-phosphatase and dual-specificity protein phosphatase PTEN
MTQWIKKLVSGKRNRLQEGKFDLDMTYVTDKIIAMSFPASGFESIYRNSISDVSLSHLQVVSYLNEKHKGQFKVYNMSGREYNQEIFGKGKTENYDWADHHSPCIEILFQACEDMYQFLSSHKDNVIVVHCNAGKGRTGTVISCFLLYSCLLGSSDEAIKYYGIKRFKHGKGVTQGA